MSLTHSALGSCPAATTRAMMSRSVTMATTRPPSTTGSGPFSFWIISLAASTTLIDGETVAGSTVMTSRTLGILLAPFTLRLGYKAALATGNPLNRSRLHTRQPDPPSPWSATGELPVTAQPFTVDIPQTTVDDLRQRLARTR